MFNMKRYLQNIRINSIFILALGWFLVTPLFSLSINNVTNNLKVTKMIKEKKCSKCGEVKPLNDFANSKRFKDGKRGECKDCEYNRSKEYKRTKKGLISSIYSRQIHSSKRRKYKLPTYTKEQLTEWLYSETNFERLYDAWVKSDYDKWLKPSVDRKNDYTSYTLDNIQLMTWQENNNKAYSDIKNGINNKKSKIVLQYDLKDNFIKEYYSIAQACRDNNLSTSNVVNVCNNKYGYKTAGGYKWKYKNDCEI